MSAGPRVLLLQLSERTSAKGNRYLSGWLGKASVVAFLDEQPDKFGNPQWSVFVSTPEPKPEQRALPLERAAAAPANPSARPVERGSGWRGSTYRRPANARRRAPAADDGAFPDHDLADLSR